MFRKLTLSFILTACVFLVGKFPFAATIIDNGTNTNYNLTAADSLVIAAGTYTGNITGFPSGAKITVIATFSPASFPNNAAGKIYNYGTATLTGTPIRTNTNFALNNYGVFTINGTTIMNGKDQLWTNNYGGIINFSNDVTMNGNVGDDNNVLINYETINSTGVFKMNSGSSITNNKDFNVTGTFQINGGTFNNYGRLDVTGNVLLNNGASSIRNYCRMEVTDGITNTSGNFYNYSYVRAINSDITNSANIINLRISNFGSPLSQPMIEGRNYFHSGGGTMTGPALLYFTGTTSITGGTMGVGGVTTDTIKMNDITRSMPTQILDVQSGGTINPNVIYNAWGVPDPSYIWLFGCSYEIFIEIPLAINWTSFDVMLSNDIPLLTWSAEFSSGTVFEIQRSYDSRNFSLIKTLPYKEGQSEYEYSDKSVNTQAPFAYYRIKAIEISGVEKYTHTRAVKFTHKPGSIYTAPNPFTNNFIINYTAVEKETITIRMFNVSGQQMFTKNVTVNNGNNSINITEAGQLAKGIYVLQVSKGHNMISSSKIIKQ